ncbi:MAG: FkbM family methyltransferase [Oculatellaceae cyanobacterium Prado106]|jgi:FkbM family methyltransferase|nr:FkbM family methyltransferase [Oculatellaceae cyanobacterium Prado106]
MQTSLLPAAVDRYWQYLESQGTSLNPQSLPRLVTDLEAIAWEEPQSALDLNNFAVLTLIEAEQCEEAEMRGIHLELALEALQTGIEQHPNHPLCLAHLAIVQNMLGNAQAAMEIAFPALLNLAQVTYTNAAPMPLGLVYLPSTASRAELLHRMLQAENGWMQTVQLFAEAMCQAQLVFYNQSGIRFLRLAHQLNPHSADLHLKLGITNLMQDHWEGLLHLQQARKLAPHHAQTVQALYLAYRNLGDQGTAQFWLNTAQQLAQSSEYPQSWQWATLAIDSPFTYLPFDDLPLNNLPLNDSPLNSSLLNSPLQLAVEPSLKSIVTLVLLAEGDWFEAEMEFWRKQIQPGMTVIDVGANVGVYTFSAARKVGSTGQVVAVEPFSGCVGCLQETRRVNQMEWVTICAGAASDRPGTARLSLHAASELNEIVMDDAPSNHECEEVACFTLDSLIDQENLTQVDWLKIDAEGHEVQVLEGSVNLINRFAPGILYENIAAGSGSNLSVAQWLQARGYQLFRYQPYLQNLIPIDDFKDVQGNLNIIALPTNHSHF